MEVIKKEKQTKIVDVTIDDYIECDKCNCRIEEKDYDAFKSSFIYETGDRYPDSAYLNTKSIDLCKECGVELMELLKSKGYRINSTDWDY